MVRITLDKPYIPIPVPVTAIKYGLLYNWYAATDVRNIAAAGWEVPKRSDFDTLIVAAGTYLEANYHLKETGTTYWIGNTGADNTTKFNSRGQGLRWFGGFQELREKGSLMSRTDSTVNYYFIQIASAGGIANTNYLAAKHQGMGTRLIKTTTSLSDGEEGTYTGNDGKVYRTICIGTQEWLADNLAETKYRNGDTIPEVTDNSAWAALTTGALCAYNNDWSNVLI